MACGEPFAVVKRVREDWLDHARDALIRGGVDAVSVQSLSRRLGVTRGGFYGYFRNRDALLHQLLRHWRDSNTRALRRIASSGASGRRQFDALVSMWIEDADYSPPYDAAVRDWARRDARVASVVRRVDSERIRLIGRIFERMGFPPRDARIRARITYYHQVGYYTLAVRESRDTRRRLRSRYAQVLLGSRLGAH